MQTLYIGNTLVNDIMLGSQRMDDTLENPNLFIEWLLVGGGASGGTFANRNGGGGGAGRMVTSSLNIQPQSISITVGAGGVGRIYSTGDNFGADGINSTAIISSVTYTAPGGGGGAPGLSVNGTGRSGGSGGGAAGTNLSGGNTGGSAVEGNPISGFGNAGQNVPSSTNTAGVGGGAGGVPTGRSWVDGITYAVGGGGGNTTAGSGTGGAGINGNTATASNGIFKLRYFGTPIATGGTITQVGGFTYHTFTTNGTFTY